jgi:hypothetical protein
MKLVHITTAYDDYLNRIYEKNPELINKSYKEQKAFLDYDCFGWADFWSNALEPLGYQVLDITLNAEKMQRQWALENDVSNSESIKFEEIVLKQLNDFQPEILWYDHYEPNLLKEIRSQIPSINLVLGWSGSAIPQTSIWKDIDLILSCAPESVEKLQDLGFNATHLHHGFEPRINNRLKEVPKTIDFSFIGQIVRASEFHLYRDYILEQLAKETHIQIYTSSANLNKFTNIKTAILISVYEVFQKLNNMGISRSQLEKIPVFKKVSQFPSKPILPVNKKLIPFLKPAVFGLAMYQTILDSKIILNIHADSSPTHASNMRLFETTGVGTCLLTDWKENLSELFEIDREVVTYKSVDECIEKAKWLLEHPQERELIAKAGQARTLKDHTFAQRAVQLDEIIRKALSD